MWFDWGGFGCCQVNVNRVQQIGENDNQITNRTFNSIDGKIENPRFPIDSYQTFGRSHNILQCCFMCIVRFGISSVQQDTNTKYIWAVRPDRMKEWVCNTKMLTELITFWYFWERLQNEGEFNEIMKFHTHFLCIESDELYYIQLSLLFSFFLPFSLSLFSSFSLSPSFPCWLFEHRQCLALFRHGIEFKWTFFLEHWAKTGSHSYLK